MAHAVRWNSYGVGRWRRHIAPILVWLGALSGVVWLIGHRAERVELVGIARAEQRQVASLSDGRLAVIPVRLYEPVKSGQTLVVLEDDRMRAALASAAAETARLRAELQAAQARLVAEAGEQESAYAADVRRFAIDVEQTRVQALELTVTIETQRITLHRLQIELDRVRRLCDENTASQYELDVAETDYSAISKEIEESEKTLAQLEHDLRHAIERRDEFATQHAAPVDLEVALRPFREAVTVQEALVAELALQQATLSVRSPIDGVVAELHRGVGEVVRPGEPILTIVAARPSEVVAYASEAQADHMRGGDTVQIESIRPGLTPATATSNVVAVGPAVVQLPERLWSNPSVPEWGCPVRLSIPSELSLRCDELVAIRTRPQDQNNTATAVSGN